jgi:hypothetical protein
MRGHAKTKYLEDNFETVFKKHDEGHHNYVQESDADAFLQDILGTEEEPSDK